MMVCICNAVRERDLRSAAREGAEEPRCAYRRLGKQVRCGQCIPFAREVIQSERAAAFA